MMERPHPVTFPHVDEISKNSGRAFCKLQAEWSSMRLRASSVQKAGLLVVRLGRGGCPRVPGGRRDGEEQRESHTSPQLLSGQKDTLRVTMFMAREDRLLYSRACLG